MNFDLLLCYPLGLVPSAKRAKNARTRTNWEGNIVGPGWGETLSFLLRGLDWRCLWEELSCSRAP